MSRSLQLSNATERQLALLERRPDLPITIRIRTKLLRMIEKDLPAIWEEYKLQMHGAEKGSEPRARLLAKLLDKILVEQRDVSTTDAPAAPVAPMIFNIQGNINRGTLDSLPAIEVKALPQQQSEEAER